MNKVAAVGGENPHITVTPLTSLPLPLFRFFLASQPNQCNGLGI